MKRTFVTITNGGMTGMLGELESPTKVFIGGKTFNFQPTDYKPSTFEEIFDKFIKGKKLVSMDENFIQKFENGYTFSMFGGKLDTTIAVICDNTDMEIAEKTIEF